MRIAIMGAGLLGVTSAYYLAKDGHQVTVLDRQEEPAREASHATACLLTPGHTIAWASPKAPWQLLASFWRKDAALVLRPRLSRQLMRWSLRFLGQCTSQRYRANTLAKHVLAKYSLGEITSVSEENRLSWDNLARGVNFLVRDRAHFKAARHELAIMEEAGVAIEVLESAQLLELEPCLRHSRLAFAGALRLPDEQSGDGQKFALGLADRCRAMGVEFRFGVTIGGLGASGGRIAGIRTTSGMVEADAYVLALGSYSPLIAASIGLDLPVYPVKGYSVTMPVLDGTRAPTMGGVEEGAQVSFSRLGERVRMTTTAEIAGYDTSFAPGDFAKILRVARDLFDGGLDIERAKFWACLRPTSPDGPPIIGASPLANLWLNTGHGYLGWTMSCGSSRLLSDLIAGRTPEIDSAPYRLDRF